MTETVLMGVALLAACAAVMALLALVAYIAVCSVNERYAKTDRRSRIGGDDGSAHRGVLRGRERKIKIEMAMRRCVETYQPYMEAVAEASARFHPLNPAGYDRFERMHAEMLFASDARVDAYQNALIDLHRAQRANPCDVDRLALHLAGDMTSFDPESSKRKTELFRSYVWPTGGQSFEDLLAEYRVDFSRNLSDQLRAEQ